LVQFPWWTCGVGAGTFEAPFKATSNGYFAEWIAFFASALYLINAVPFMSRVMEASQRTASAREQQLAVLLLIFSFIELLAALVECNDHSDCSDEYGWAIFVGIVSCVCSCGYLALHATCMERKLCFGISIAAYFGYSMLFLWVWGTGVLTFDKPFVATGNGYFSSWGAMITSILFAGVAGGHLVPAGAPEQPPVAETINIEVALPVGQSGLFIESRQGTVMSITDGKDANGATVATALFEGRDDYCKWTLLPTDEVDWFYLIPAVSADRSRALHIPQKSKENGIVATLMTLPDDRAKDGLANFKVAFDRVPNSDSWFFMKCKHSNKCLHIAGASKAPKAEISQADMEDKPHFHWKIKNLKEYEPQESNIAGTVPENVISR